MASTPSVKTSNTCSITGIAGERSFLGARKGEDWRARGRTVLGRSADGIRAARRRLWGRLPISNHGSRPLGGTGTTIFALYPMTHNGSTKVASVEFADFSPLDGALQGRSLSEVLRRSSRHLGKARPCPHIPGLRILCPLPKPRTGRGKPCMPHSEPRRPEIGRVVSCRRSLLALMLPVNWCFWARGRRTGYR